MFLFVAAKLTKPQPGFEKALRDLVIERKAVRPPPLSFCPLSFSSSLTDLTDLSISSVSFLSSLSIDASDQQARKIFAQPNMFLDSDGKVVLKEYELSVKGVVESCVERRGF